MMMAMGRLFLAGHRQTPFHRAATHIGMVIVGTDHDGAILLFVMLQQWTPPRTAHTFE